MYDYDRSYGRTAAGAPRGRAQMAIMEYLERVGESVELTDITGSKSLLGVHFKDIMSAAAALKSKGLITYDGKSIALLE